jgi:hypothetical protein
MLIINIIIIIIIQSRKMNSAKSTPPQRGVITGWSPETRTRSELNRLVLNYYYYYYYYYHHHHHHHHYHHHRPHIITQDRQCVGSKLLSIFAVDNTYGDDKASNRMSFQASRLNICQYLLTLPKGIKRQYALPHGAARKYS